MPKSVGIAGREVSETLRDRLLAGWRSYFEKIRTIEISRPRKGGRLKQWDPLMRYVNVDYDANVDGEDRDAFLASCIEDAIDIARDDAHGKKQRYAFAICGEQHGAYKQRTRLADPIEELIDLSPDQEPTKESEHAAELAAIRGWAESASALHLKGMEAGVKILAQLVPLADAVMKPRGEAAVAETNAQVRMVELGNQLAVDLERIKQEGKSSERWFYATESIVKAFGGQLGDMFNLFGNFSSADFDGAAAGATSSSSSGSNGTSPPNGAPPNGSNGTSSSSSGPTNGASNGTNGHATAGAPDITDAELKRIFASRPEAADILSKLRTTNDPATRAQLIEAGKRIWLTFNPGEGMGIARVMVGVVGPARSVKFSLWIRSMGFGQQ